MLNHARAVAIGILLGAVCAVFGIWVITNGSVLRGIGITVAGVLIAVCALVARREGPPPGMR
jgi:hypothetical protein